MKPAVIVILWRGDRGVDTLLILSQVVLSLQLPFAIFPLMHFTSDPKKMGVYANPLWLKLMGYVVCYVILALNIYLLYQIIGLTWLIIIFAGLLAFWTWTRYLYNDPSRIEARATD